MIWFGFGILIGLAAGIPLHFRITREERKAFDVAVERMRAANARCEAMARTLRTIKAMLHRTRGRRNLEFGGPVGLPIAAESLGQQSAKTTKLNGRR